MRYIGVGPEKGTVVDETAAFAYALERCLGGTLEEQADFKEMLVGWYYSNGDWIKEESDGTDQNLRFGDHQGRTAGYRPAVGEGWL